MLVTQLRLPPRCSLLQLTQPWSSSSQPHCGEPGWEDPENNGSLPRHVVGLRCPGSLVSLTEARNEAEVRGAWRRQIHGGIKDPHSAPKAATIPKGLGKAIVAFLPLLPDVISNMLSQDTL